MQHLGLRLRLKLGRGRRGSVLVATLILVLIMPDLKPSMEDSTLHSVSVVAVVSERQAENHFSLNQKPIAQPDHAR